MQTNCGYVPKKEQKKTKLRNKVDRSRKANKPKRGKVRSYDV